MVKKKEPVPRTPGANPPLPRFFYIIPFIAFFPPRRGSVNNTLIYIILGVERVFHKNRARPTFECARARLYIYIFVRNPRVCGGDLFPPYDFRPSTVAIYFILPHLARPLIIHDLRVHPSRTTVRLRYETIVSIYLGFPRHCGAARGPENT